MKTKLLIESYGLSIKDVALVCDITDVAVYKQIRNGTEVPAEHVLKLAQLTGFKATPHDIRPDLYPHPDDGMRGAA